MTRRRMHPGGVAEDRPVFDLIFFYFSEPCREYRPPIGKDGIVDSPTTRSFSEKGNDVSLGKRSVNGDPVTGIGVKEVLPAELHLRGSSEAVAESVGEGVIFGHESAQTGKVRGVDGGNEGLHDFSGGLRHKSMLIG